MTDSFGENGGNLDLQISVNYPGKFYLLFNKVVIVTLTKVVNLKLDCSDTFSLKKLFT